ncbi:MAG: TonB-dependent receptor [Pseudomonadota bacterium]
MKIHCILAAGLAALPAAPAFADASTSEAPEPSANSADRIIITGTRSKEALDDQPYAISVVDQTQIERELPRTVPEALTQLPGVLIQKTASGHGSPYIRGFTGNRTLLVIDGVRYNNATFRDGANEYFAQIDTFTLDQIELIAGPASALYGSEAVGGVLNLITRGADIDDTVGLFLRGEQTVRVSNGDQSIASRTAVELGEGSKWGFRTGATIREYGDIRAAQLGRLPESGYSERALDARLDVALGSGWSATVDHQSLWQDDVPRTHSTVFSVPFAGTRRGTDLQRDKDHGRAFTYVKVRRDSDQPALTSLELTLSHQARREEELRVLGSAARIDQSFVSDLWAFNAVASADAGEFKLTYGLDLSHETIDSARVDTDQGVSTVRLQGPVGTDARYDMAGFFVRGLADITSRVVLDGSLRLSFVDASVGQFADPVTGLARSFDQAWSDLSGSLRLSYLADDYSVWAAFSRSFRAPNIADISRFGRSRSSEIEVASLTLEPETFDTFELGYRGSFGALNIGASAYTTRLNNYIATVPTGQLRDGLTEVAKRNAASGYVAGIELSVDAEIAEGFVLSGNATWLRGRLTLPTVAGPVEEPISRIQPLTGNLRLTWEPGNGLWALAELALADRADKLSSGDLLDVERIPPGGTPGYVLFGIRGGARIGRGVDLTFAFNNLFDDAYRTHGSGNNEAGRHVMVGLQLSM